jgi:hypothetical protein
MLVRSCGKCDEQGFLEDSLGFPTVPCECLLSARATSRLISGGFKKGALELVKGDIYQIPDKSEGLKFVEYAVNSPDSFEDKGLGLYVFSEGRGQGKTTLVHHIMYNVCRYFYGPEVYDSSRTFAFEHIDDFLLSMKDENSLEKWKATWYVLDGLGNEDTSAKWKKDFALSALQRLFHYRRDNNLPILITSNKPPEVLTAFYSGVLDSLLEIQPDGGLGGLSYRAVHVISEVDYRLQTEISKWEIS